MKSLLVKLGIIVVVIGLFIFEYVKIFAFDVDGFKSGMVKKEVKEILNKMSFDRIEDKVEGYIGAYDNPTKKTYRNYYLFFRNDKLFSLQRDFPPSMKNFIALFNKFTSSYGKPFDCFSKISTESYDPRERREISFMWKTQSETIDLKYIVFPSNDQLSVTFKVGSWDYIK